MVAIVALSLATALVLTVFGFFNALLIRRLPFEDGKDILTIMRGNKARQIFRYFSYHDYFDYVAEQKSLQALGGYMTREVNLGTDTDPKRYGIAHVTPNFLEILRVQPVLGRGFLESDSEPTAEAVVMISHGVWQKDYAGAGDVVGKVAHVDNVPLTIVGVMPGNFGFPENSEVWAPLNKTHLQEPRGPPRHDLTSVPGPDLVFFGRLGEGSTIGKVESEFGGIAQRLAREYPVSNHLADSVRIRPLITEIVGEDMIRATWIMQILAISVFLIACFNVANILLARFTVRRGEFAVRRALGANTTHLARPIICESLIIAGTGTAGGIVLALGAIRTLRAQLQPWEWPLWLSFEIDRNALLFCVILVLFSALVCAMLPIAQTAGMDINRLLKDDARTTSGRFRKRV